MREGSPDAGAARPFLATVIASFGTASGRTAEIADALMLVPEVSTVRVEDGGRSTVYRADLVASSPAEAVPGAGAPAARAAELLHAPFRLLSVAIEEDDDSVPRTGRGVVLERRYS